MLLRLQRLLLLLLRRLGAAGCRVRILSELGQRENKAPPKENVCIDLAGAGVALLVGAGQQPVARGSSKARVGAASQMLLLYWGGCGGGEGRGGGRSNSESMAVLRSQRGYA